MAEALEAPRYTMAEFVARWAEVKRDSEELEGPSVADRLAACEGAERGTTEAVLDELSAELGAEAPLLLLYDREFWLRPKQHAPEGDWLIHLHIQGRGGGKTRKASSWTVGRIEDGAREVVLAGPTMDDVWQYMVGGHRKLIDGGNGSGLLDVMPPWIRYNVKHDAGRIEFPDHGTVVYLHSGEVPEFRGPNPDTVWCDEIIRWRYPFRTLSNLRLACRAVGKVLAQMMITTSPKRWQMLRDLVMEPGVSVVHGRTDENRGNVDERWFRAEDARHRDRDGNLTRQGEEELGGELLGDQETDLFPMGAIERSRITDPTEVPAMDEIVVAVDPSGSTGRTSDNVGVVAAGRSGDINTGKGYVLEAKVEKMPPETWGKETVLMAERLGASSVVVETSYGARLIAGTIRSAAALLGYDAEQRPGYKTLIDLVHRKTRRRIRIEEVLAKGDKVQRADPVSTMYKTDRVQHVGNHLELENEISEYDPSKKSPGGMDALVHAFTYLFKLDRAPEVDGRRAMKGLEAANAKLDRAASSGGAKWLSVGGDRGGGRGFI